MNEKRRRRTFILLEIGIVGIVSIGLIWFFCFPSQSGLYKVMDELVDPTWSRNDVLSSIQTGNGVIAALEKCKYSAGAYPKSLSSLSPDILAVIPLPTAGNKIWKYRPSADQLHFELEFSTAEGYPRAIASDREKLQWFVE